MDETKKQPADAAGSSEELGLEPERAAFERWAAVNGYALRRDEGNRERYHAWVSNTLWNGWKAGSAAERERICNALNALPGGHSVDPQWVADMVRGLA